MITFRIPMLPVMGVLLISYVSAFEKRWLKTNSWINPSNWEPPRLPCPNDNIVLKEAIVYVEKNVTMEVLPLPTDGEIIFGSDCNLVFDEKPVVSAGQVSSCSEYAGEVTFIGQRKKNWLNPMNWDIYTNGIKDEYMTKAVPYIERVPCINDRVSFPKGDAFAIDIHDEITIKDLILDGQVITEDANLQLYLAKKEGKARFNFLTSGASLKLDDSTTKTCGNSGCKCGNDVLIKKICNSFKCPRTCVKKVKPQNDCCYHCGALINIDYDHTFNLNECSRELRTHLLGESSFSGVRLYMSPIGSINNEIQVLVSEDSDGSNAEAAADFIQDYIKKSNSIMCGGMETIKTIKFVKQKDETPIVLAVSLTIFFLCLIIAVVYFWRKRCPAVQVRKRFENEDDFTQYPGVHDDRSDFADPNLFTGITAFANPLYEGLGENEAGGNKNDDVASPEYAIPIDYLKKSNNETAEPRYTDVGGLSNPRYDVETMFDENDYIEGDGINTNPLYELVMKEFPEKLPAASEVDLDSTDDTDSIRMKLELKLKDLSDSDENKDEEMQAPVEEIGDNEPENEYDYVMES